VDNLHQMQPMARDVKIQVDFNTSKVRYYRLIGYDNRLLKTEDFEDDATDAGDMGAGQQVTAIYEIIPRDDGEADDTDDRETFGDALMNVKLRYLPTDGKTSVLLEDLISWNDQPMQKASSDFRFASAVAAFGMVLRDSPERGAASYDMAEELARGALGRDGGGYRREFLEMITNARGTR
jgi:Ca-activated chloride channel family protein